MPAISGTDQQYTAVSGTSAKFTNAMLPGIGYRFTCNTDCWVAIGATGGAAVASTAGNTLCMSGQVLILRNADTSSVANSFVHVIRNAIDGKATLSPIGPI